MPVQVVAIVVYEGVQALDVAGPMDVFSEANTFSDSADRYETVLGCSSSRSAACVERHTDGGRSNFRGGGGRFRHRSGGRRSDAAGSGARTSPA